MCVASLFHRKLPARRLPVANTVSEAVALGMAVPLAKVEALLLRAPATPAGWASYAAEFNAGEESRLPLLLEQFWGKDRNERERRSSRPYGHAARRQTIAGRLVAYHIHDGADVAAGGSISATEAILMPYHVGTRVISVDYRIQSEHPFPATVDESISHGELSALHDSPESHDAFGKMVEFFDRHPGRSVQ